MKSRTHLDDAATIAERLGVTPRTVLRWARRSKIPAINLTKKVIRFDWPAVLAAVRSEQS